MQDQGILERNIEAVNVQDQEIKCNRVERPIFIWELQAVRSPGLEKHTGHVVIT